MKKKILFITGTRADYGKIKPLMQAVQDNDNFKLYVYVTGMHLSKLHGSTYIGVIKDGWENIQIDFASSCHEDGMAQNLSRITGNLANYIRLLEPDLTVIHGDRIEALSGALASTLQNVRTAHIEGGEVSGTIDESIRHAITKMAHEHFVSSDNARDRLLKLGEELSRIHVIGSPDIDVMLGKSLPVLQEVKNYYEIPYEDFFIGMLHPVTTDLFSLEKDVNTYVSALIASKRNGVIIYPNNDLGHEIILSAYARLRELNSFRLFPSIRFESFLTLLKNCKFIIGNSSAGIREAGIYGVPAIDIGSRQQGRYDLKLLKNLQHVEFDICKILNAINKTNEFKYSSTVFGKGDSSGRFINVISDPDFWKRNIQKRLTY